ncbi:MAG TPA: energy-coupling factor transporter transmembrane component T [Microbacteriaceae bacterium]|nr:energy-coupling factor transporter transmembrane component T [Microbacteriaceae bacterium]
MTFPAGVKLVFLALSLIAVLSIRDLPMLAVASAIVALCWLLARPGLAVAWRELRAIVVIAVVTFGFNVWWLGVAPAVLLSGRMVLAFSLAALVTVTTPTTALVDAVSRAARPIIGARRADTLGLMVSLVIRTIPVLSGFVHEVNDARKARGQERSLRAFAVPVVVRSLRAANELGDALAARGVADGHAVDPQPHRTTLAS